MIDDLVFKVFYERFYKALRLFFVMEILFKVHESYRSVVSVCDKDVYGRRLKDGDRVLDLTGPFFDGDVLGEDEVREKIADCVKEDATFNIVGEDSVALARSMGLVKDEGVIEIEGVPFALVLL